MNKSLIKIIIFIVFLVLLSLLAVQAYWVKNTYDIELIDFHNKVNDAMNEIISNLEKTDINAQTENYKKQREKVNICITSFDSLFDLLTDKTINSIDIQKLQYIINKTRITRDSLVEIVAKPTQFDKDKLLTSINFDSLIKIELTRKGITIPYEFGIYSPSEQKFIIVKTGNYNDKLLKQSFVFILFPSNFTVSPDYLMVYFPFKTKFLIRQTSGMIFISFILIVIIIMLFIYIIKIIVWQNRLTEMKNDLINNITHEIKTPISTISLACEALSDKDIKGNESLVNHYLKTIEDENSRLGGIVEKIIQNIIIEKEDFRLKREKINIGELINNVVNDLSMYVELKDGKMETTFNAKRASIFIDRWHTTNAIRNLVDNAIKYSPRKPLVRIISFNNDYGVFISVIDNGIGISKEDQKKIFDKLYRVPTGNIHDVKGFGLGLSYVKTIVDRHGGYLTVESEPTKGSKFTMFLPFSGKSKNK